MPICDEAVLPDIRADWFPTPWQTVLWRSWGLVPAARIAQALHTDEAAIRIAAGQMGLNPNLTADPEWTRRGYATIIRNNWNLVSLEQLTCLTDMTADRLSFLLREDDFLLIKLGGKKPLVAPPVYAPLSDAQRVRTEEIARLYRALPDEEKNDHAFSFVRDFTRAALPKATPPAAGDLRMVYSYFALYGDPLLDASLDPFPDALLEAYAQSGVNGVWLQGVLYQLGEYPFEPSMSEGWEKRIENLRSLTERAAKFGVGVYLYLNEPRSMPEAFFERYPDLRGRREGDSCALCTSTNQVRAYLENAMEALFTRVPLLAGFFTITVSENLTNCHSRYDCDESVCPRCGKRAPEEVIAEVNNCLARGAHRASPSARAIAWNWGWQAGYAEKVPPLLTEGQIVQCTSEEGMPVSIAGCKTSVIDYTLSLPGPGPRAKSIWRAALISGHETCAKIQVNNTWEMSAVPWMPVFDKVAEHVDSLKKEGVKHLMLSWTLGGYPSPMLRLAGYLMDGRGTAEDFLREWLGHAAGDRVNAAQKKLCEAFSEFPFHLGTLYYGPQNSGPAAPFYAAPTGRHATMVGFPYDDLESWRAVYPPETFLAQFEKLCAGWNAGVKMLAETGQGTEEILRMAQAAQCHFESARNHIAFVLARGEGDAASMRGIAENEYKNVSVLMALRARDARIGYEASNHYFYSVQDLAEKLLNLRWLMDSQLS